MATREPKSEYMPQHGEIVHGPLEGWRFAFLRFVCIQDELYVDLRCTPPSWPFPQDVRFSLTRDRFTLAPIKGDRTKRLNALALMTQATERGASSALED